MNRVLLSAQILERKALRYTPLVFRLSISCFSTNRKSC